MWKKIEKNVSHLLSHFFDAIWGALFFTFYPFFDPPPVYEFL